MGKPKRKYPKPVLLTGDAARAEIEKRIRYLQRRIAITANPKIKKWAEKALFLGRYQVCYWILKVESHSNPDEYEKWLSWFKRIESTLA